MCVWMSHSSTDVQLQALCLTISVIISQAADKGIITATKIASSQEFAFPATIFAFIALYIQGKTAG